MPDEYVINSETADASPAVPCWINGRDMGVQCDVPFEPTEAQLAVLERSRFRDDMTRRVPAPGAGEVPLPVAFMDFKNGTYTLDGVTKTAEEMLEQNWDWGPFDFASIVNGVGIRAAAGESLFPTIHPTVAADLLAGVVALLTWKVELAVDAAPFVSFNRIDLPDQLANQLFSTGGNYDGETIFAYVGTFEGGNTVTHAALVPLATNNTAVRLLDNSVSLSVNGEDSGSGGSVKATPATHLVLEISNYEAAGSVTLEKLELFDPEYFETDSTARLRALSNG